MVCRSCLRAVLPGRAVRSALLLCPLLAATPAMAAEWTLSLADWDRPRSARALLGLTPLAAMMAAYMHVPDQVIVLDHGPEEMDILWSQELRGWLIALGVDSDHIRVEQQPIAADSLIMRLEP